MTQILILCATAIAIVAMLCLAGLKAWSGWLALRRLDMDRERGAGGEDTGLRIELAHVRERLRKLEQIASGVDP